MTAPHGAPRAGCVPTRFIVVRHGQTRWNVEKRVQGQEDSPLTDEGLAQAQAIAERLSRERFDVLVASDLGRTLQTAEPISTRCGLPIVKDSRLRERNFGEGEGLLYDEIDRRWPDAFSRVRESDPDAVIPGGETRRQFHERVHRAFESLVREYEGKRVAVVTHGGVLAALYRMVHSIPVGRPHKVAISNASYNAIAFTADAWSVETWDDVSHLPGAAGFVES